MTKEYRDQWKGMGDWLGTGYISNQKRKYRSFEDAQRFAHKLSLKSVEQWKAYCKSGNKPQDIPFNPNKVYTQKWKGWGDWLGTGRIANADKSFKSFGEAREFVRSLGLKNQKEWIEYYKSGKKPSDIPSHAHIVYKDSWRGFGDWLGTYTVAAQNRQYLPFEEARKYVQTLGIKGYEEWIEYCKSGKKPLDIPTSPQVVYRNDGWKTWGDWLGTGYVYQTNYHEPKQKLTLSLSKEIIERAKFRNINISALTENLLNTLTYSPVNGVEEKEVIESYERLFEAICSLLKNYGAKVEAGLRLYDVSNDSKSSLGSPIVLDASGLSLLAGHNPQKVSVAQVLYDLYDPGKILQNAIVAVTQASEKNKEKVRELQLVLRFVNTIFDRNDGQA